MITIADTKISGLTAKTTLGDSDLIPIVDIEATPDETKKETVANFRTALVTAAGVNSAGAVMESDGLSVANDGTKTTVTGTTGDYNRIGEGGTTAHSLDSENDLMVTGELETKGVSYLDGNVTVGGTVDGRDLDTDGTKLDTIATSANAYVHPNHSGEVTSVADGAQTIAADAVTYAKMQNVSATDKILGRETAGAGNVEEIACTAAGRALLDDATAAAQKTTLSLNLVENTAHSTDAHTMTIDGIDVSAHATAKSANATLGHVIVETASKVDVDGDGKLTLGSDVLLEADLEGSPTEDLATKAPTSEWAFDHDAAATGVHGAGANTILYSDHTADADAHGEPVITCDTNSATADDQAFSIVGGEGIDTSGATKVVTIACEDASTSNKGVVQLDDTAGGTDAEVAKPPTSNAFYDHVNAGQAHSDYLRNDASDSTSGDLTAANLIVGDAGNIGSASDTDAIAISAAGILTFSGQPAVHAYSSIDQVVPQSGTAQPRILLDTEEYDIRTEFDTTNGSGTAEVGTAGTTLHDDGVFANAAAGDWVWNTDDDTYSEIASIAGAPDEVVLDDAIFAVGEDFRWYRSTYTVGTAGKYLIVGCIRFINGGVQDQVYYGCIIRKNGAQLFQSGLSSSGTAAMNSLSSGVASLSATDEITLAITNASGGASCTVDGGHKWRTYLMVTKIG